MAPDLALELLASGYRAIPEQRARAGGRSDFTTRLLGRSTLVVRGADGARLFYNPTVVVRHRAVPAPLAALLFGAGAIHGLDGAAHLACPAAEAHAVVRDLATIVDGFGGAGAAYVRAWGARLRMSRWARGLVRETRSGHRRPATGTALAAIARAELSSSRAAVELLNVLRPTVAVAWLGSFAVLALHDHPAWRSRLASSAEAFAEEVRRTAPFVPALTGLAARPFDHDGRRFRAGTRIVLDVPGTDTDPALWRDADAFRPGRFEGWRPDPWSFVPQGGGYADAGHRCPGEPATVAILAETLRVLAAVDFDLPDPRVDDTRIPTVPRGGLRITRVRHLPAGARPTRRPLKRPTTA